MMLVVDHVRKSFGTVEAVRDVAFSVEAGSAFGLLGPNGAGKTTTMRMILGIYVPDGGTITWRGAPVTEHSRKRFGYLPEERGLYPQIRVRDQIVFFARLHGMHEPVARRAADAWIERLELSQYALRPCAELSKGNQQKVQVACAAAFEPELMILDEPFSGLDPVNAELLADVLRELRDRGVTMVFSSHQMWQIEELCSAVCIIANGANRIAGRIADLRAQWPTRSLRVAPASEAASAVLARIPGAHPPVRVDGAIECTVPAQTDFSAVLRELVSADSVTTFDARPPSLHDIYLHAVEVSA
jgi:ABC-2 type transport system ATP-binding protein